MDHDLSTADLIAIILNGIFGVIASYLTLSLLHFEIIKHRSSNGTSNKKSKFLRSLCIVASMLATIHHFVELGSYFSGDEHKTCMGFGVVWLATYALGLLATYVFLWTRQHTINTSPSLSYMKKKPILILSWSSLVILVLGIVMVFLAGSRLIFFSKCSEQADSAKLKLYTIILSGILVSLTVVGQVQLLALFIIPLIKHHRQARVIFLASNRASSSGSNTKNILLIKRCVLVAVFCVITDVVAAVVTISVQHPAAKLTYDFNLLVNAACCAFSFRNWCQMLLPCGSKKITRSTMSSTDPDALNPSEPTAKV